MTYARTIKPENWQTLADTLTDKLGYWMSGGQLSEFRAGKPSAETVARAVRVLRIIIRETYNGQERSACKSIAETLMNYGIVSREAVADLLPL